MTKKEIIKTFSDLYVNGIEIDGLTLKEAIEKWQSVEKEVEKEQSNQENEKTH